MDWSTFFEVHRDLPREGPGEPADVAWATALAGTPTAARICDAACGPGADIASLLQAAPQGHVTAIDKTAHFVDAAQKAWGHDSRVTVAQGDMAALGGPFDLIWCAGAVYFLGVPQALDAWRGALAPGGAIAFSEPCWFTDTPSSQAKDQWAEYPAMRDADGIAEWVAAAGFQMLGTRVLSDAAWEAYYTPMEARIARLRPGADSALTEMLDMCALEAATWRATRAEAGYLLCVVRPV